MKVIITAAYGQLIHPFVDRRQVPAEILTKTWSFLILFKPQMIILFFQETTGLLQFNAIASKSDEVNKVRGV